jgi:hypothetical protein
MVWRTINGRRVNVRSRRRRRHLYSNKRDRAYEEAQFTRRYGKTGGRKGKGGRYVYGAVVGKVRREQAAAGSRSHREVIPAHYSHSRRGRRFRVKRQVRYI